MTKMKKNQRKKAFLKEPPKKLNLRIKKARVNKLKLNRKSSNKSNVILRTPAMSLI
jgi:hypothetical protein